MRPRCLVLFYEGETDELFYRKLLQHFRNHYFGGRLDGVEIVHRLISTITKFETKLLAVFKNEILPNHADQEIHVLLCHDHDVFLGNANPPVNWKRVETELMDMGAASVDHISADPAIEEVFALDCDNIRKWLKSKKKGPSKGNGYEWLKSVFKEAERVYYKGGRAESLIAVLNMETICDLSCPLFRPLCTLLGIPCEKQNN